MPPEAPPRDRETKAAARREKVVQAARREKVVQAARTLFAEQGFHSTGIAQISKLSGVLVGQIYRDFANKEAIVAAIVERDLEEFLDPGEVSCADGVADAASVRAWIMRIVAGHELADARLVSEIMAEAARNERVAAIFQSIDRRMEEQIGRALRLLAPDDVAAGRIACIAGLIHTLSAGVFQRRLSTAHTPPDDVMAAVAACIDREIAGLG